MGGTNLGDTFLLVSKDSGSGNAVGFGTVPVRIFYSVTLFLSAMLVGGFARTALTDLGFVPNVQSGLLIFAAAAVLYIGLEFMLFGGLRLVWPTRSLATYLCEIVSHSFALVLIPYMLHWNPAWPHPALERLEIFIYLGAFAAPHLFLKMATFYGSLEGAPDSRREGWVLAGLSVIAIGCSYFAVQAWLGVIDDARVTASETVEAHRAGYTVAMARSMQEGATLVRSVEPTEGISLTSRWSVPADSSVERVYATVTMEGRDTKVYESSTKVSPGSWGEIRVPNKFVPEDIFRYSIRWTRSREPNWQRIMGLRPIVYTLPDRPGEPAPPALTAIMSGPFVHKERPAGRAPNIVMIIIDGLAVNHLGLMGYERNVTPSIDRVGYTGLSFANAQSPSREPLPMMLSILSAGQRSSSLESAMTLPEMLREAGYVTAAFTEGEAQDQSDLLYGDGMESGFEVFDASYTGYSEDTVEKARAWIANHRQVAFFVMIRLRGLEKVGPNNRYEAVYPESGTARDKDHYDNALTFLDRQVGSLLKYIRDRKIGKTTAVVITAPYGNTFSLGESARHIGRSERVPLIINAPGIRKGRLPRTVSLNDVAVSLGNLAGVRFPATVSSTGLY